MFYQLILKPNFLRINYIIIKKERNLVLNRERQLDSLYDKSWCTNSVRVPARRKKQGTIAKIKLPRQILEENDDEGHRW